MNQEKTIRVWKKWIFNVNKIKWFFVFICLFFYVRLSYFSTFILFMLFLHSFDAHASMKNNQNFFISKYTHTPTPLLLFRLIVNNESKKKYKKINLVFIGKTMKTFTSFSVTNLIVFYCNLIELICVKLFERNLKLNPIYF